MHSYAHYQRNTGIRRRGAALDGMQPGAALSAYVTALDVTTEAVLIVDRSGTVVYANDASAKLLGVGSLIGRQLSSLYSVELRILRNVLAELKRHGVWHGDLPLQAGPARPNPSVHNVAVALRNVAFAPGRSHHFCLVARPSSLDEAPALSAVARVAGEIAHDFNNQIAVVLNYSFILLRQLPDDSPLRAHVAEMQSAAWRASQVAQQMLGFGGQRRAEIDDIDLNALLSDVQALFTHALREDTQVERRFERGLWRVRARRAHLEWLMVELATRIRATIGPIERLCIATSNAASDSSPSGHAISISVEAHPRTDGAAESSVTPRDALGLARIGADALAETGARGAGGALWSDASTGLRAAELALSHVQGELAVQLLPSGGVHYRILLPAV